MKTKGLILLLCCCFQALSQTQAVIGQPEMRVLYMNYVNIIECSMMDADSSYVICQDESVFITPSTYNVGLGQNACFEVYISNFIKTVELEVHVLKNGVDFIVSKEPFKVKAFPKPFMQNTTVSHTTGAKIQIGLGPDCPFTNVDFEVSGGNIDFDADSYTFSGNLIPPDALKSIKPGKKVPVQITYQNSKNGAMEVCSGILTVVP